MHALIPHLASTCATEEHNKAVEADIIRHTEVTEKIAELATELAGKIRPASKKAASSSTGGKAPAAQMPLPPLSDQAAWQAAMPVAFKIYFDGENNRVQAYNALAGSCSRAFNLYGHTLASATVFEWAWKHAITFSYEKNCPHEDAIEAAHTT